MRQAINKCVRVPYVRIVTPHNNDTVYKDYWWTVTPDNNVLFYEGEVPQCNRSEQTAKFLASKMYPDCTVSHVAVAFVPGKVKS